ncbi:MAG: hypothetical protein ACTHJ8_16365 [Mucilaginibacter sp.]
MERTEPVNSERSVSLLVKIWLYPNVSAFKIAKKVPVSSMSQKKLVFIWLIACEAYILYYGFPNMPGAIAYRWLILILLVHGLPEFIFSKTINDLAANYYIYYSRFLFYIFLVFFLIGFIIFGKVFYDSIGHVK